MAARILDGAALSKTIRADLTRRVEQLVQRGIVPKLVVLVAEHDPASLAYVRMKSKWAREIGILTDRRPVRETTTTSELVELVHELCEDSSVHGVLVQHPLPKHVDEGLVLRALAPGKDVDGITPGSLGLLASGMPGFRAATPLGIMRLLASNGIEVSGLRAVVVGRSVILGKPAALLLLEANATVTIAHSRTRDLPALVGEADLVLAALGKPEFIQGAWLKEGCIVVDAGYNRPTGASRDVGDCDFDSCSRVASWITPVPGGVGPMTVASLLSNVVEAAELA